MWEIYLCNIRFEEPNNVRGRILFSMVSYFLIIYNKYQFYFFLIVFSGVLLDVSF